MTTRKAKPAPAPAKAKAKRAPAKATPAAKPGPTGRTAAEMARVPTVGRIVHVYDHALGVDGHAGRGPGPYAAIITHIRPPVPGKAAVEPEPSVDGSPAIEGAPAQEAEPETVDVVVFAPAMGGGHERGALPYRDGLDASAPFQGVHRYWTWPTRA